MEFDLGWTLDNHQLQACGPYVSGYTNDRSGITDRSIDAHTKGR